MILINRNRVSAKDKPKSWKDLANPKWKGAILMDDPRSAGAGHALFVGTLLQPELGEDFHRKLAQNKPVFLGAEPINRSLRASPKANLPSAFRWMPKL